MLLRQGHMTTTSLRTVACTQTKSRVCSVVVRGSTKGDVATAKAALLDIVKDSGRGFRIGRFQRGVVEEAQVNVESFSKAELDWSQLAGKWKLVYTSAQDVLIILEAEYRFKPLFGPRLLEVGDIYQRFTSPDEGVVENIIEAGILPGGLLEEKGVTFTVGAKYEVRSGHRIALTFEEAGVDNVKLAPLAQALLAPALLPRGYAMMRALMAVQDFKFRLPFQSLQQVAMGRNISAGYQLTYLDQEMLIGRATQLGGTFVFIREPEPSTEA